MAPRLTQASPMVGARARAASKSACEDSNSSRLSFMTPRLTKVPARSNALKLSSLSAVVQVNSEALSDLPAMAASEHWEAAGSPNTVTAAWAWTAARADSAAARAAMVNDVRIASLLAVAEPAQESRR